MFITGYSSIGETTSQYFVPTTGEGLRASASSGVVAVAAVSGDTVSISEAARILSEQQTAKETETPNGSEGETTPETAPTDTAQSSEEPSGGSPASAGASTGASSGASSADLIEQSLEAQDQSGYIQNVTSVTSSSGVKKQNATGKNIQALQKQVEAAQEQLDQANQALQKATTEARADPAIVSETDSDEVKDAQTVVTEANNRVLQLQEQITRAMREAYGISAGGGGCIQGTRAGGMGGGGNFTGTIGSATDPFAAARAAEAAELQGSGGTTAPEPEVPAAPPTEEPVVLPGE